MDIKLVLYEVLCVSWMSIVDGLRFVFSEHHLGSEITRSFCSKAEIMFSVRASASAQIQILLLRWKKSLLSAQKPAARYARTFMRCTEVVTGNFKGTARPDGGHFLTARRLRFRETRPMGGTDKLCRFISLATMLTIAFSPSDMY